MLNSTALTSKRLIFLVIVWVAIVLCSILYASLSKVRSFDPQNKFFLQTSEERFEQRFLSALGESLALSPNMVISFSGLGCFCETLAASHLERIEALAIDEGFQFNDLDITLKNMRDFLPSTPAIAVINDLGSLSYLGPIGAGPLCAQSNDLVGKFIKKNTRSSLVGSLIVSDTKGCYCNALTAS